MKKYYSSVSYYIGGIATGLTIVIIVLFVLWSEVSLTTIEDVGFLSFIVSILALLTTINMALAAFKIVTASSTEKKINKYFSDFREEFNSVKKNISQEAALIKNVHFHALSNTTEILLDIFQEHARNIAKQLNIDIDNFKELSNLVTFSIETQKEAFSIMQMLFLTLSGDHQERLLGYQRLATIPGRKVSEYMQQAIKTEENVDIRTFLLKEILRRK